MPTLEMVLQSEIIGRKIPSGSGMDMDAILASSQEVIIQAGGIEALLKQEAERTGSFVIGLDRTVVEHKNLSQFKDWFTEIGLLEIKAIYKESGSYGGAADFANFARHFPDLENYQKIFRAEMFKIADLLE